MLDTAHENVQGPYAFSAVSARGRLAYTNNGISGAMRGFGALQVHSALEQQIERLARLAGVDPRDFRARNLRADDAPSVSWSDTRRPLPMPAKRSSVFRPCLRRAATAATYGAAGSRWWKREKALRGAARTTRRCASASPMAGGCSCGSA